jgi:hypothetical protein
LQGCYHHEVRTPDIFNGETERYSIPVTSVPVLWKYVAKTEGVLPRSSRNPHRYGATLPLQPRDYGALNYHLTIFLGRKKDRKVMLPADPYYAVYIRILTFNIENNNLEDFNDLMDIVYLAETQPDDEGARVENQNLNCNPYPYPHP